MDRSYHPNEKARRNLSFSEHLPFVRHQTLTNGSEGPGEILLDVIDVFDTDRYP